MERTLSPLESVIKRIERTAVVDRPAKAVNRGFDRVLGGTAFKNLISGSGFGHALHPALTDVVTGSFISASALDLIGGENASEASERLIMLGIAAYGPTAITGTSDWTDGGLGNVSVRRVGIVHAAVNAAALSLYGASLAARRRGKKARGVALGFAGAGALGAAAYLGGHLTMAEGVGVDQTVFDTGPPDWTETVPLGDLADGVSTRALAADTPVLLFRRGESVMAIHDRCSHRGCSLVERGEVQGDVVTCNCHGSQFSIRSGALLRGPATRPQPAFDTRVVGETVEVRAADPDAATHPDKPQ